MLLDRHLDDLLKNRGRSRRIDRQADALRDEPDEDREVLVSGGGGDCAMKRKVGDDTFRVGRVGFPGSAATSADTPVTGSLVGTDGGERGGSADDCSAAALNAS